jgi:hypothetical protein
MWRHGIQHNDTQHNGVICDTQHNETRHTSIRIECSYAECRDYLNVMVTLVSVVTPSML